ncbi:ANK1 [Symbiodinium pilosum]|uniref:ANK1 protein n=1 Tax=Symbiodinium pilosum TaxID=2952 RepID=A0A812R893_SYMPI|nr:ANK1 [Symbiodinium pilosum]
MAEGAEDAVKLADYMQAVMRRTKLRPPLTYGYKGDPDLGVGFWMHDTNKCKVLEKPIVIPSGLDHYQGYSVFFAYCGEEGVKHMLEGACPPILPATEKEPADFASLADIANNFGAKDPEAAKGNSEFCVAICVPQELATKADVPGRDIWMIQFEQDRVSAFLQAAKEGNVEKLEAAMKDGIKGNLVDEHGVSALMMAAFMGSNKACEALLQGGAEVNHAERLNKRTALMMAAQGGHEEVVKSLLAAKADTKEVDSEMQTALHWAAVAGKTAVARLLASIGQKDAKNEQGETPAQVAEKMGHTETAAALM